MSGSPIDILFVVCDPRSAHALTDEIMDRLEAWKVPARTIRYGIMQKGSNGFSIIATQGGMPADLLEILQRDGEVGGYVVLEDTPAIETETEVQG